jgi:hypothetical protein
MLDASTLQASRAIRAETLSPRQHRAKRPFRIATSYWVGPVLKMPGDHIGEFHSYPEYLNAGLVQGDPSCTTFIPQPLALRYHGKPYKPDASEIRNGTHHVVELKPGGEFDSAKTQALNAYLALHHATFEVRANESVLAREWEAVNWHTLVQQLTLYRHLDTDEAERQLMENWPIGDPLILGDILEPEDREASMYQEAALFRLTYRGWCTPEFDQGPLDYATRFFPCPNGDKA